jgi:hypothetical protein
MIEKSRSLGLKLLRIEHKPLAFKVARGAISSVLRKVIVAPISLLLIPSHYHQSCMAHGSGSRPHSHEVCCRV